MSKSIFELVDELPTSGLTVFALQSLDFVIPGQWQNVVGFTNTIRTVTAETDEGLIQQIGERAIYLFNDKSQGYQNALWIYQTIDFTDKALGAAAMANKVGEAVSLLGFLDKVTPKAEKAQTIDFCMKLVGELVAFCQINGIPGDSIGDFVGSLADYSGESLMRIVALLCFDGLVPLGPDFLLQIQSHFSNLTPDDLQHNPTFQRINALIPGGGPAGQLSFIGDSFNAVQGWMTDFVSSKGLTPENVVGNLRNFIEVTDDKLDYLGAFLDVSTNYYEHTGIQTLARRLVERAVAEI
ncbi:hypothetical protein BST81_23330 [Leptolyngbya sp. 'hensonii']|uniref:hypothetical protein n=1 Tax=Leptolyngbya sp. 'hensonii' TaxID=1922337 RepID=UPI00094F9061|nr:hypothetical protein [Leptolyngbya sp. 'hensonii']OLP15995.1 hypothetical protein BST81_23330 [Leptolyngbya sp. 'hensonii']